DRRRRDSFRARTSILIFAGSASMWRALTIIALCNALPAGAADQHSCLQYGPIRLVGTLVRQTYAGPPDYESVTKGDEPRVIWVLQLDRRVCVSSNVRYPREPAQVEVELALPAEQYAPNRRLLGQKIIATGELVHGGANYQKRLVLQADNLQKTSLLP
ncbi:MAG: hypothetical protein SXG53_09235, partial [Pseudomonadota bacterium]|nr:hypothetical protein [Pseudomonadota bacterium]